MKYARTLRPRRPRSGILTNPGRYCGTDRAGDVGLVTAYVEHASNCDCKVANFAEGEYASLLFGSRFARAPGVFFEFFQLLLCIGQRFGLGFYLVLIQLLLICELFRSAQA